MRLTKKVEDKAAFYVCDKTCLVCNRASCGFTQAIVDRLAAYEDAEEQGLLVGLPCKVGTTVYRIVNRRVDTSGYRMEWEWDTAIEAAKFRIGMINAVGITVFLSREEAEAALKGEKEDV